MQPVDLASVSDFHAPVSLPDNTFSVTGWMDCLQALQRLLGSNELQGAQVQTTFCRVL